MATKKKTKKKGGRRHHRKVGALGLNPKSPVVQAVIAVAGFLGADKYINPAVDKVTGTMDETVKAGGQVGIGTLLVLNKHTQKHWFAVVPGALLAGAGLKRGLRAMGVINGIGGYQDVSVVAGKKAMNGYGQVKVVGTLPQPSLNGGFTVNKPVGTQIMGNANGSGIRHDSSSYLG